MPWIDNPAGYVAAAQAPWAIAPIIAAEAALGGALYYYHRRQRQRRPMSTRRYNYAPTRAPKRRRTTRPTRAPTRMPTYVPTRMPLNRRIGGYVGKELKWNDTVYTGNIVRTKTGAVAEDATAQSLTNISPGTGPTQRDGIKVMIKHIFIQGQIAFVGCLDQSAGPPPAAVADSTVPSIKLWLVMDRQTNGAQMTSTEFLNQDHSNTYNSVTFRNLENSTRFKVLAEKTIMARSLPGHSAVTSGMIIPFKMKATNVDCYQRYIGTDGTVGSIADCSLHLLCMKSYYDSGSADLTSDATLTYVARTRFYAL